MIMYIITELEKRGYNYNYGKYTKNNTVIIDELSNEVLIMKNKLTLNDT